MKSLVALRKAKVIMRRSRVVPERIKQQERTLEKQDGGYENNDDTQEKKASRSSNTTDMSMFVPNSIATANTGQHYCRTRFCQPNLLLQARLDNIPKTDEQANSIKISETFNDSEQVNINSSGIVILDGSIVSVQEKFKQIFDLIFRPAWKRTRV